LSDTVASGTPSRPLLFILSRDGGGGPIIQVPRHPSSSDFCGLPRIPPLQFSRSHQFRDPAGSSGFPHYFSGSRPLSEFQGFPPILLWRPLSARSGCLPRSGCPPRCGCLPRSGFHPRSVLHPRSVCCPQVLSVTQDLSVAPPWSVRHPTPRTVCHPTLVCPSPDPKVCLSPDLGPSVTRPQGLSVARPRSVLHPPPGCRRSRRLRNMDPEDSLDAPALPPSNREAGASSPAPLLAAGPSPSPVVLQVLPLRGSPTPIGYIYDASPEADGGLLAAASAFFSHQGHQVFHDPCPDLAAAPQLPSSSHSVASGLGSTRGVGLVMGGVGIHVPSSAPPMGGPGVPGGTSATLGGLPGRRPDPDDGVMALGHVHPDLGIPPSVGGVGAHTGVSGLDMRGLGVPLSGLSQSGMGGTENKPAEFAAYREFLVSVFYFGACVYYFCRDNNLTPSSFCRFTTVVRLLPTGRLGSQ